MKLLICHDPALSIDTLLADLKRAGLPERLDALVLSLADFWPPPETEIDPQPGAAMQGAIAHMRERAGKALAEARAAAEAGAQQVRAAFPAWQVSAEAQADAPAWAIIRRAEHWPADLVVVGSHGRSALGRLVLGSVAHRVVTEVRRNVRIARTTSKKAASNIRVIVGTDGSPDSDAALAAAAQRSWPAGTQVRVVTVIDYAGLAAASASPQLTPPAVATAEDWAPQAADRSVARLRAAGLEAASTLKIGDPKRALVDEAKAWEADCIFVGARGQGRIERFLLGSVSTAVAMRAGCSVEIIHPSA